MLIQILFIIAEILIFILAVMAIVSGRKKMKASKAIEDKKIRYGLLISSGIHMWCGIIIVVGYVIIGIILLQALLNGTLI